MDYNSVRDFIESIYHIAGIALVWGIIVGIRQLNVGVQQLNLVKEELEVVKKDFQVRNKRASVEKSIEYLNWFATDFIPQTAKYGKGLDHTQAKAYSTNQASIFFFDEAIPKRDADIDLSIQNKMDAGALDLVNQLEFFSAAMMSGLADEELAFNPLGLIFCEFVEHNYDVYCYLRDGGKDTMFSNTIGLYRMWKERIEAIELEKKSEELAEKMSKIQKKSVKYIGNE